MENPRILRRYTDITSVIDILVNKKLTLVDPQFWDDKNDSYFMSIYKESKSLESLSALCFTSAAETYHHWKIFSGNNNGACVVFNTESLLSKTSNIAGIKADFIKYKTLRDLDSETLLPIDSIPFVKRYAFRDEKEFRIIYESKTVTTPTFDLSIDITDIDRVFLSPWIHPSLVSGIKGLLKSISGCSKLKITRSTVVGNENWKKYALKAKND